MSVKLSRYMLWEQRWHPLREEWVIIAAHRQDRPWVGEVVGGCSEPLPEYVGDCYLCPGNIRAGGQRNPNYTSTFVFDNDFPCVGLEAPVELEPSFGIYRNKPATGIARVLCYHPAHNLTLAEMDKAGIQRVLEAWQEQFLDLAGREGVNCVHIFENKGEVVGVSNPHPHCQIYATNFVFKLIETELNALRKHWNRTGRTLVQDIIAAEKQEGRRILCENETAIAFVPYFARYAYEVFIATKSHRRDVAELTGEEVCDLAAVLKAVLVKFDNLWQMPFPYVMVLHNRPTDGAEHEPFHFHIEIYPPLRKPKLLKYLAGPEIGGGNFLSDTSPEAKAQELQRLPDKHYKDARIRKTRGTNTKT